MSGFWHVSCWDFLSNTGGGNLGTQTQDPCLLRSSQADAGLSWERGRAEFYTKGCKTFCVPWTGTCLEVPQRGDLVACSHPKSPSDKIQSKLAVTFNNNKASNGSKSQRRGNTPEILLFSFLPTLYLLTQTFILKAMTSKHALILLDA